MDNEIERNIDGLILNEATVVNKFKQTMTLYNADTRPAEVLYPRHPSAGNRIDKQSGDAIFFFSTQEEAIKYVVGKGLSKEYMEFCDEVGQKLKQIEKNDPEKAKRIKMYIAQINKFTEGGKYPPVFRKIGVHMKYFGMDDAKVFPEFPFCRMFIERAMRSSRPCYIRICNVPTEDIKHGHCANYKEFTVFKPCKVDKMLTFTLGQLFSKVSVKYFTQFDDFKKFLPTITKNFDKDLFRGLISYQDFRKRLQWSDGKKNHEQLNSIDTGDAKNESVDFELEELMEDVFNEGYDLYGIYYDESIDELDELLEDILYDEAPDYGKYNKKYVPSGKAPTKGVAQRLQGKNAIYHSGKNGRLRANGHAISDGKLKAVSYGSKSDLNKTRNILNYNKYSMNKNKSDASNAIEKGIEKVTNKANDYNPKVEITKTVEKGYPKGAKIAAGVLAAGAAAYGGKKLYDKIKAKRREKVKEVAVEESMSLEESALLVVMIENDFLNEGYELEEIYNEKVFSNIKQKYNDFKEKNKDKIEAVKDYAKLGYKGAKDSAKAAVMAAGTGYIVSQSKLGRKLQDGKVTGKVADFMGAGKVDPKAYTPKALAKGAAIGAGLSVAGGMLSSHLAKKAREREEKERQQVNESTLFDIVLECEEELLDEGYSFEEIYGEDADSFEEFDIDDNVEQLTDAAAANFMEWQKGYAGKTINKIFKKRRDKVRAKVKAGKPLNKQEQELWDRMQSIQSKRVATLRANKAAKKNNN